jgi:hypothetical protein
MTHRLLIGALLTLLVESGLALLVRAGWFA